MANPLVRCQDCGRLFGARPGKLWCAACATERVEQSLVLEQALDELRAPTHEALAKHTGIAPDRIRQLIKTSPSLNNSPDEVVECMRCKKLPAQLGSDFCLDCRLELNRAFGRATDSLFAKFPIIEYEPKVPHAEGGLGLTSTLREKRTRSGPRVEEIAPGRGIL